LLRVEFQCFDFQLFKSSSTKVIVYAGYQESSSQATWDLLQELRDTKASLILLDHALDQQLASLPQQIAAALREISQARQESNHEFATITSGIGLGRIIRNAGTLINTPTITSATVLSILGASLGAGAYAAARAVNVRN
jgi:hypothetical protein